jgi:S-DNA-T family DNA segregation ATPase FtsK/SpoIIIE
MASKIYTDRQDEKTIDDILKKGLRASVPKWSVLRLALGCSLRIDTPPDASLDHRESEGGKEYSLEQLTGEGKEEQEDFTLLFRALLSVRHKEDLFADSEAFVRWLQRHVRRGLREFRTTWIESHDFHDYLLHELLGDLAAPTQAMPDDGERLLMALSEIGVAAEVVSCQEGPRLSRYHVCLKDVNNHGLLTRGLDKLAFALGLGERGVFVSSTSEPRIAAVDIPRIPALWHPVPITSLYSWLEKAPSDWRLPVYIGQDVSGLDFGFDLASAPHLLIGGTTGSGKSVCLHALLLSLIDRYSASQLQLLLIDPKRVELARYANLPHVMEQRILNDAPEALTGLQQLVDLMNERETILARSGARDIDDPQVAYLGWARIVVVVEEFADLIMQSGSIEEPLVRLAQKARASGIHLVLATQRPDAQTFSGLLRSNIPSRIALSVQKGAESRIILDETGAEKLLGKGDMLVKLIGKAVTRIHGVFIRPDDIAQGIDSAIRRMI